MIIQLMWVALKVWIFIAVTALVTVLFLKIAQRNDLFPRREIESGGTKAKPFGGSESVILYVMANLVSQGISANTTPNLAESKI